MGARQPTAADSLESGARQLRYAMEQSATLEQAFQMLYAAADQRQHAALRQLEHLLRSPEPPDALRENVKFSSYPVLAWLLRQTSAPEKSAAAVFREYRRHESFSAAARVAVRSEFAGFLTYLGAVLAVLIVVVCMYGLFILPQFRSLYGGFGRELPTLTGLVFGGGAPLFTLLLLSAFGLIIFLCWFVYLLRRQLRRYVALSAGYERIPLVGPVAVAYHQYLWLSYAGLLRAGGIQAADALRLAATRVPVSSVARWGTSAAATGREPQAGGSTFADLSMAERLGKLDDETQFQQEASVDTFLTALARCRRRARIVLTLCVYYLVATFVSAMYLPIFSLGSAF